jgi:hypothetical protein
MIEMAIATFTQNVNGFTGTIDTMLRESRPTQSYAVLTGINIDSADSAGLQNQGLLYFDVLGARPDQIPFGSKIISATLTLQVTEGSSQGGRSIACSRTGSPFRA